LYIIKDCYSHRHLPSLKCRRIGCVSNFCTEDDQRKSIHFYQQIFNMQWIMCLLGLTCLCNIGMETSVKYTFYILHVTAMYFSYLNITISKLYRITKGNYLHESYRWDFTLMKEVTYVDICLYICRRSKLWQYLSIK
jgi:hypothetical protein